MKKIFTGKGAYAMAGQLVFLMSNFVLFYLLINQFDQVQFGAWALYITLISIADSFRQGLIQNGLTKFLIEEPNERGSLIASGILMNYGLIVIIGIALWGSSHLLATLWHAQELDILLPMAFKSLLGLGTIQFLNALCFAREDFKSYLILNILYGTLFIIAVLIMDLLNQLSLSAVINLQLLAAVPVLAYALIKGWLKLDFPQVFWFKKLIKFGKYVAGTNLMSLLFNKADILIIGHYMNPAAVAIYHFATKIINYGDLPLNAISQVIYPKLVSAFRDFGHSKIQRDYARYIMKLLVLVIPLSIFLFSFKNTIINILSSATYTESSQLISILLLAGLLKPWGRVFGLTLDALGMPKINFQMLLFSVITNVIMNLIFIPIWGLSGAAWATTLSIALTVFIGQLRIRQILKINHQEVFHQLMKDSSLVIQFLKHKKSWI